MIQGKADASVIVIGAAGGKIAGSKRIVPFAAACSRHCAQAARPAVSAGCDRAGGDRGAGEAVGWHCG